MPWRYWLFGRNKPAASAQAGKVAPNPSRPPIHAWTEGKCELDHRILPLSTANDCPRCRGQAAARSIKFGMIAGSRHCIKALAYTLALPLKMLVIFK